MPVSIDNSEKYLFSFYNRFRLFGVSLEYRKLKRNFDLLIIRVRKLKLNRKMPGILFRINPPSKDQNLLG